VVNGDRTTQHNKAGRQAVPTSSLFILLCLCVNLSVLVDVELKPLDNVWGCFGNFLDAVANVIKLVSLLFLVEQNKLMRLSTEH
jgi:hypothetical protein